MNVWQKIQSLGARPAGEPLTIGPSAGTVVRPGDNVITVHPGDALHVAPAGTVTITPPNRGLWDERGWTCEQKNGRKYYQGFYQVVDRRHRKVLNWAGRVLIEGRNEVIPFIADPPAGLSRHPKWPCFHNEEGRWFRLHWHRRAVNVDDAISYMEKILDEVVN